MIVLFFWRFDDEAARQALMRLLGDGDDSDEGEDAKDILGGGGKNDKSAFEQRQERVGVLRSS